MISIRSLLMLFAVTMVAVGCSQVDPKKVTVTPEQKATSDKAHEEMKTKMGGPAEAPKK